MGCSASRANGWRTWKERRPAKQGFTFWDAGRKILPLATHGRVQDKVVASWVPIFRTYLAEVEDSSESASYAESIYRVKRWMWQQEK